MPYKNLADRLAYDRRYSKERRASGVQAESDKKRNSKRSRSDYPDKEKRARSLARKYGMTLPQMRRIGWIPPDVEEALNGDR